MTKYNQLNLSPFAIRIKFNTKNQQKNLKNYNKKIAKQKSR